MLENTSHTPTQARGISVRVLRESASTFHWTALLLGLLVFSLAALIALPLGATTTEANAYGFVSRVEGEALLSGLEGDDAIEAEVNHPLLTGDQINTNSARVELVLPDGTVIRVGQGTSVVFDTISGAPDSEVESGTLVLLDEGELQIRTPETFLDAVDLAVRTPNATVYLEPAGRYRITAQSSSFTEVVVREGFAEADTLSGSSIARDGDALEITGNGRPFVNEVAAGPADSLEIWAGDLDQIARNSAAADVDPRLAYAAAPLEEAGEWVEVDSRRAWRPYVRADWRPFRHGRWVYTPSGLTWVASARWGWVTSHYGFWDYVPGYGWLWHPGNVYMPAGVYWYWGPTHVAWIPAGYYNRHSRAGFRFGVYGWAGGDWGYWSDWTFCPTRFFGRRGYDRYWDSGRNLARERRFAVPRGIVTTDTRGLGPRRWGKPTEGLETLARRVDREGRGRRLPDVTGFVARREFAEPRTEGPPQWRTSARERLRPLPEERDRARFKTRSATPGMTTRVTSEGGVRRPGGFSSGSRSGSTIRRVPRQTESGNSPESEARDRFVTRSRTEDDRGAEASQGQARSRTERRFEPGERAAPSRQPATRDGASTLSRSRRERPASAESTPARRVLDRIRAHRETTRRSSSGEKGSPGRAESKPKSVSKGSGSGSSKAPARRSTSSARDSGSSRSSAKKSSPPSRRSSGKSSSGNGSSRSKRPPVR